MIPDYVPPSYTPLQSALWFASQGHAGRTLHAATYDLKCTCGDANCRSQGKHPHAGLAPHGLRNATRDAGTVRSWFDTFYWLNVGVTTDRLFVMHIAPRHT